MTRRAVELSILGLAGLILGLLHLTLVLSSDFEDDKALAATLPLLVGWSFIGSGLLARWRRPGDRFGTLLLVTGFLWFVGTLEHVDSSIPSTLGDALKNLALPFFIQALLAFPGGRLQSRLDRGLVALAWFDTVVLQIVALFFDDYGACGCPQNRLLINGDETALDVVDGLQNLFGIVLAISVLVVLSRRWRAASPALRRAFTPVFQTAASTAIAFSILLVVDTFSDSAGETFQWVAIFTLATVPMGFLVGLLRTRLAQAAVGRLVVELGEARDPTGLRELLRAALGDPGLRLAYWDDEFDGYLDIHGNPFVWSAAGDEDVTPIAHDGRPLAALVHDPSLRDQPELLDAVAAAVGLALEKERHLRELELSERRMRALLDATPDVMYRIRRDGTYLDVHSSDPAGLLAPVDHIVGRTVFELVPTVADELMRRIDRAITTGAADVFEYDLTIRGETRRREARIVKGGEDEVVVTVRDITERKRQEEELRASRARLVEAQQAERRRLERNLHDGAQQRLVSLSLSLRLARNRLSTNPEEATRLLDDASEELAQALAELRELARGIHPAVLTERGLDAALEALASRAPLPVEVEARLGDRLPAGVEAAAYYVVSEALANVAKYAHASLVHVRVGRQDGAVVVRVKDDGVGGADPAQGSGLRGLRDRVEALDGVLEIASAPGAGTEVRAEIPCAS